MGVKGEKEGLKRGEQGEEDEEGRMLEVKMKSENGAMIVTSL